MLQRLACMSVQASDIDPCSDEDKRDTLVLTDGALTVKVDCGLNERDLAFTWLAEAGQYLSADQLAINGPVNCSNTAERSPCQHYRFA